MNIIKQLIIKKLSNEEILLKSTERENSFGEHICAYLMSLAYLNQSDPLLRKKRILWKRFISSKDKMKYYRKLLQYKQKEDEVIMLALNQIEKQSDQDQVMFGSLYRPFSLGVLAYEYISQ